MSARPVPWQFPWCRCSCLVLRSLPGAHSDAASDLYALTGHARVQNREQQVEVERSLMRAKLLLQQLSELDDSVVLYKNVGKAYICTPRSQIIERYESNCKEFASSLEKHQKSKATLEKSIESAENEFKELIASNPAVGKHFLEQS